VVAPSRWLAGCAKSSTLFSDVRVEAIPNGLDTVLFKPVDKRRAREILCLPEEKKLILFGAMGGTGDRNKGFHLLLPAMRKLSDEGWKDDAELLVFGASEPAAAPPFGMNVRYLGRLHDDVNLVLAYAAADVFVSPSMLENLSNTVMEAMACGTPCVAFRQGGMPELIGHGQTGYLARPYEPDDLAAGIGGLLRDDMARLEMGRRSRRKAEEEFALDKVSKRYVDLYREISA
jgi:glycosyltransferase involved in cell wall biosynthesis